MHDGYFNAAEPAFNRTRCGLIRLLLDWIVLEFCNPPSSWANPNSRNEEHSQQIGTFDTETVGTLPKNFVVGTTLNGRSAGVRKVIDMTQLLNLLHDLDPREHTRIKNVLQVLAAPSPPYVLAQLKKLWF